MGKLALLTILVLNFVLLLEISNGSPIPQDEPDESVLGVENDSQANAMMPVMAVQLISIPPLDLSTYDWLNPLLSKIPQYIVKFNEFEPENESETKQSDEEKNDDSKAQDKSDEKQSNEENNKSEGEQNESNEKGSEEAKSQDEPDEELSEKVSDEVDDSNTEQPDKEAKAVSEELDDSNTEQPDKEAKAVSEELDDSNIDQSDKEAPPLRQIFFIVLQTTPQDAHLDKEINEPENIDFDPTPPVILAPVPEIPLPPQQPDIEINESDSSDIEPTHPLTFKPVRPPSVTYIPPQEIPFPSLLPEIHPIIPRPFQPSDCPSIFFPWKCKQPGSFWNKFFSFLDF